VQKSRKQQVLAT